MGYRRKNTAALNWLVSAFFAIIVILILVWGGGFWIDGLDCFTGLVLEDWGLGATCFYAYQDIYSILLISDLRDFAMCAISLFLSAFFKPHINSCFPIPFVGLHLLYAIFFHKLYLFQYSVPVYMVLYYVHLEKRLMGFVKKI